MKKIGLIGGMSWESTELYYRQINELTKQALGGHHSARLVLDSLDFHPVMEMQHQNNWQGTADVLVESAKNIERAGADFILICTNTMHKVAPEVDAAVGIPLLHLADATAQAIINDGHTTVGFLGTKFSMEDDFYIGRLKEKYGLTVITPNKTDRELVHKVIYEELCLGQINDQSREQYIRIIQALADQGAQCVIEGCTEIAMLVNQSHTPVKLYDTTAIHAQMAVEFALAP
ncbi:aspartate/glutamate racemase family protein [Reinekea marina]|uniref:Aspartate/glutamate racemase family protein n=2 Tax=Reinekea marina TaxID=1310421 RepID=A0ABV7WTZ6_9GAMM|nr:aspartate/glutamate racemase family protein [Reinekea marina]MDN3651026.1 aspartate/glutamate racemase family protein [Reinekea marina]